MTQPAYSETELAEAIDRLGDRERFREAERLVAEAAPALQRVLVEALDAGRFADESVRQVRDAAALQDPSEREVALRTLLAEEARMGMMVGVAVGWTLAGELRQPNREVEGNR